ncbi:DUF4395 domain-containing protein [Pseudolysinimonas sp.]|jgi:hypothetical protein|uniref:DUF4395 domain-containing protein n=1 Tax=Pseudolysinimonas sp. TaxID=2680009 RepID=UPI003784CFF3
MTALATSTRGIDPRGPRVTAGIVAVKFLVVIALALLGLESPAFGIAALVLAIYAAAIFLWGAVAGVQRHPYRFVFSKLIRPRLAPPAELENPTPPTFAQGVGLVVTVVGIAVYFVVGPIALVVAGVAAFLAAFLNSVFAYCLGCQIYLLLARAGIVGRRGASTA